ncbi:flagellar hook-length control protein FliK [Pararhodospirillum photometricum]|nr:flagellar hook-length control protein FliK [Pararhodospirillum photometricum]
MDQVKVNISKALDRGMDQVSVQLTPKTLGRIDVKMDIGSGGEVQVSVLADNQQTLDLLRSDQRGLERALQEAGLKADSGSIDFGLRGGSGQENLNQDGASSGLGQASRGTDTSETETLLGDDPLRAAQAAARGGVDIRV